MTEEWRDIVGYEGIYQVSSMGNVRSLTRCVPSKNGSFRRETGKYTTKVLSNRGYYRVMLNNGLSRKWYFVHRLVAEAFIPNPDNFLCVNHKDENRVNNKVTNLEWCSYKYNSNYGSIKDKISRSNRGKKRNKQFCDHMRDVRTGTKLSEDTKLKIGKALRQNWLNPEYRDKVLNGRCR